MEEETQFKQAEALEKLNEVLSKLIGARRFLEEENQTPPVLGGLDPRMIRLLRDKHIRDEIRPVLLQFISSRVRNVLDTIREVVG